MGLQWARLDANIASHDKILSLLSKKDGHRAFTLFVCALGWSVGQGTDGQIPKHVLPVVHGEEKLARLLIDERLWAYANGTGHAYQIVNFAERQMSAVENAAIVAAKSKGGTKGNCVRWHGDKCWSEKLQRCSRINDTG